MGEQDGGCGQGSAAHSLPFRPGGREEEKTTVCTAPFSRSRSPSHFPPPFCTPLFPEGSFSSSPSTSPLTPGHTKK